MIASPFTNQGLLRDGHLEIRLHGRGGQGGVTCAKILAALFARTGHSVQAFGDYAGERSGAPVRAYMRASDTEVDNRNKIYTPDHLLVLDPTLLGDDIVGGLKTGGTLLINTPEAPEQIALRFPGYRVATVDATAIARRHGIGSRSVVIVNTTLAGAFARAVDLPLDALAATYDSLGLRSNLPAAKEAWTAVRMAEPLAGDAARAGAVAGPPSVIALTDHTVGAPTGLKTGSWRTQAPKYAEHLAPCNAWCPAGNDVVGFVQALAQKGEAAAAAILDATTPLAGVCGRVCPAPCMDGCNRREYDGAVHIRGLERWIADHRPKLTAVPAPAANPKHVAVVGGGPAGLAAAHTLAKLGHKATLFDAETAPGGVLRTGIPGYRLPRDVLDREVEAILGLGVELKANTALSKKDLEELPQRFDGVVLATGLQRLTGLEVPGANLPGIEQGIAFLKRVNSGEPAKLTGHVVVLGGGNTAMDCARSALRAGASRVTVAYRRAREDMPAIAEEVHEAEDEGIVFAFWQAPVGFSGTGRVQGITLAKVEAGPPDESGRRRPVVTSQHELLACDAVLLALGQGRDLSLLPEGWSLETGRISCNGAALPIFAAGDVATGDGTVTHAIGDGRRAAQRLLNALGEAVTIFERPDRSAAVPVTDIRLDHFTRSEPAAPILESATTRAHHSGEVSRGLASLSEAHRCMSCGHCTQCDTCLVYCPEGIIRRKDGSYAVDYSFCKGCGICVSECPRKAMEMSAQ